jgi:hypothetical protein
VEIGGEGVIMEVAVIRSAPRHPARLGITTLDKPKAAALENRQCSCIVTFAGYTEGGKRRG